MHEMWCSVSGNMLAYKSEHDMKQCVRELIDLNCEDALNDFMIIDEDNPFDSVSIFDYLQDYQG